MFVLECNYDEGGICMLEVVKDVVKSKTMIGVMVFIIGISYISASQKQNLMISSINQVEVTQQVK
jgi:hypothetical protein